MADITTDQLKAVAEYMGYEVIMRSYNLVHVYADEEWSEYDPITNAEQDRELEIKFEIDTERDREENYWVALIRVEDNVVGYWAQGTGKTPSEARLRAAIALVESE